MKRVRLFAVYLAFLAAWMQFLAPVAMSRADADPFSIICSHQSSDSKDGSAPLHRPTHHQCCTLCHAQLGALTVDNRPVFTVFDYPVTSPLRWRLVSTPSLAGPDPGHHPPRGPPSLV